MGNSALGLAIISEDERFNCVLTLQRFNEFSSRLRGLLALLPFALGSFDNKALFNAEP